jgi:O-methyltransferase
MSLKEKIKSLLPWPFLYSYRKLRSLSEDLPILIPFLFGRTKTPTTFIQRLSLIVKCYRISYSVDCPHMENEMIKVMSAIFSLEPDSKGIIVEAGSYKGGSSAKISLAARLAKRKLFIFDSFEGLPKHREIHEKNIFGGDAYFPPESYAGSLEEVNANIRKFGAIEVCEFKKGWFEDTMPLLREPVGVGYLDVDLESSTKTCLKYLYSLVIPKGILLSQDGHLPWIIRLLDNDEFWQKQVGCKKPEMIGLRKKKLVIIKKDRV